MHCSVFGPFSQSADTTQHFRMPLSVNLSHAWALKMCFTTVRVERQTGFIEKFMLICLSRYRTSGSVRPKCNTGTEIT